MARGLAYSQPEFEQLWLKILDRAPAHMGAHLAALHYWCEKWHGSREVAYSFAEAAAARAPQGSLLAAMPLFAVFEHLPEVNLVRSFYQSEVVTKAVHGALFAVHAARPDDPMLAHVRHLLVFFLVRSERWAEAMNQLVHVDGHVGALPWTLTLRPGGGVRGVPGAGGGGVRGERGQPGDAAALRNAGPRSYVGGRAPRPSDRPRGDRMFLHSRTPQLPTAEQALRGRPKPMFTVPDRHTVLGTPLLGPYPEGLEIADFGLGCFWGAERKFWQLPAGVYTTLAATRAASPSTPRTRRSARA